MQVIAGGTILAGKYRVERLLGSGGMGAVYQGRHVEIDKRVAIKVIGHADTGSRELAARFRQEARAASLVESDGIIQVFDVGDDPVVGLFMVMELLAGEDLAARVHRDERLDVATATSIARQAALALAKAHAAGVVHRDLKPANLFLVPQDDGRLQVKILDFGISKLVTERGPNDASGRPLTTVGAVIGTPQYMSPEQAQGLPVDHRTDVWSLGTVLYEMLVGACPYPDMGSYERTIIAIVTQTPKPLAQLAPWVPPELAALVHHALTHEVDRRLQDCATFAERLLPFTRNVVHASSLGQPALGVGAVANAPTELGGHGTTASSATTSTGRGSRNATLVAAGGLAIVLAVSAATFIHSRQTSTSIPSNAITTAQSPRMSGLAPVANPAEDERLALLDVWVAAHQRHDVSALEILYAEHVLFYGRSLPRSECVTLLRAVVSRDPSSMVSVSDVRVETSEPVGARIKFLKTLLSGGKTAHYPSYLVLRKEATQWKIVEESDEITDRNLAAMAAGDTDAEKPKDTGPVLNTNQVRTKQCCSALRGTARSLERTGRAFSMVAELTQMATMCDSLALQVDPTSAGQPPELAPLGLWCEEETICPPVCQGLFATATTTTTTSTPTTAGSAAAAARDEQAPAAAAAKHKACVGQCSGACGANVACRNECIAKTCE